MARLLRKINCTVCYCTDASLRPIGESVLAGKVTSTKFSCSREAYAVTRILSGQAGYSSIPEAPMVHSRCLRGTIAANPPFTYAPRASPIRRAHDSISLAPMSIPAQEAGGRSRISPPWITSSTLTSVPTTGRLCSPDPLGIAVRFAVADAPQSPLNLLHRFLTCQAACNSLTGLMLRDALGQTANTQSVYR